MVLRVSEWVISGYFSPFLVMIPFSLPLFGKWFDETHHPELVEGEGAGEIL